MGFNTRDRDLERWIALRARQVRALDRAGLALHLVVTGARGFNDKSLVTCVLDRIHRERGIGRLIYFANVRTTYYADRWAQSRHVPVRYVRRSEVFDWHAHGAVCFDGPDDFVAQARRAGLATWRLKPRPSFPG